MITLPRAPRPYGAKPGNINIAARVPVSTEPVGAPIITTPPAATPAAAAPRRRGFFPTRATAGQWDQQNGGTQMINEPAVVVGLHSHDALATIGENQRELMTIQPVGPRAVGPVSRSNPLIPGVRPYADGGQAVIGDIIQYNPNAADPNVQAQIKAGTATITNENGQLVLRSYSTGTTGTDTSGANAYGSPTTSGGAAPAATSGSSFGAAGQNIYNANQGVQSTTQAEIDAKNAALDAKNAEIAANRGVVAAQSKQLTADRNSTGASQAYLDEQKRATAAARADELAIEAARANTADVTATAEAQNARNNEAYKYTVGGLAQPTEVTLPNEGAGVALPPGVVPRIQSQEEILTDKAKQTQTLEGFTLDAAQQAANQANIDAQRAGLDVTGAQLQATTANLNSQQANLAADRATLGVTQAQLNLDIAQTPPPGQVYDSVSGTFMSPEQFQILQQQRGIEYDPVNKVYVPRAELQARTDANGNIQRTSDGVWVNPTTHNELVNGVWTDPTTGDYYDPKQNAWVDPSTGNKFVMNQNGPGYNSNANSGDGYWVDPNGFVLGSDGVWRNPANGDYIVDGVVYHTKGGGSQYDLSGYFGPDSSSTDTSSPAISSTTAPTVNSPSGPTWTNPATGAQVPWRPAAFQ